MCNSPKNEVKMRKDASSVRFLKEYTREVNKMIEK